MGAGSDELRGCLQSVDKGGACSREIETPNTVCAELVLNHTGRRRKKHVGRDRGHNKRIQIGSRESALRQCAIGSLNREIAGSHTCACDVALADAGAVEDPIVRCLDHLFQIVISQQP